MIRYKCAAGLAILFTAGAVLSGCTGLPDRQREAERLEVELSSMPGVERFTASYSNDYTAGSYLNLTATMPAAPEGQIAEVAKRINDLKRDDFDGYRQRTKFIVGNRITGEFDAVLNPDQVADRSRRLRQIGSAAPTADITWSGNGLDLRNAPPAAESFAAVRSGLAAKPAHVTVLPQDTSPMWEVDFPFNAQQEAHIQRQLSGLPVDVAAVTVANGALSSLSVRVHDPKTAYQDLAAVIAPVQPTPEHPMMLQWTWAGTETAERKFAGSVQVSGCQYPRTAGEEDPHSYYAPEAIDLQRRLRDEFDTCR